MTVPGEIPAMHVPRVTYKLKQTSHWHDQWFTQFGVPMRKELVTVCVAMPSDAGQVKQCVPCHGEFLNVPKFIFKVSRLVATKFLSDVSRPYFESLGFEHKSLVLVLVLNTKVWSWSWS